MYYNGIQGTNVSQFSRKNKYYGSRMRFLPLGTEIDHTMGRIKVPVKSAILSAGLFFY